MEPSFIRFSETSCSGSSGTCYIGAPAGPTSVAPTEHALGDPTEPALGALAEPALVETPEEPASE